jgi:hypothetical protein
MTMALASIAVLNPKPAPHPLRRVTNGEPDARIADMHRLRDVLEIFVEAAAFGRACAPARKVRLDADDRAYERSRTGHGTFRRADDEHERGVAARIPRAQTTQTESRNGGVR